MMKSREELIKELNKLWHQEGNVKDYFPIAADFIKSEIKEDRKKTINLLNRETILEANFTCSCNGFLAKAISKLKKHWEEEDEKV